MLAPVVLILPCWILGLPAGAGFSGDLPSGGDALPVYYQNKVAVLMFHHIDETFRSAFRKIWDDGTNFLIVSFAERPRRSSAFSYLDWQAIENLYRQGFDFYRTTRRKPRNSFRG